MNHESDVRLINSHSEANSCYYYPAWELLEVFEDPLSFGDCYFRVKHLTFDTALEFLIQFLAKLDSLTVYDA